ncbi:MAG: hypothetical protein V1662_05095 [Candidatus Omnitrophota bacterium]
MKNLLGKSVWSKVIFILLAGLFLLEPSAYALKPIESVSVLQDYDYTTAVVGLAASIALPCVGSWASSIGQALELGALATTAVGVGMGAAIGAMPGLVSGNSKATAWGALAGGIGGGFGAYNNYSAINTMSNEINRLGSQMSQVNGVNQVSQDMVNNAGTLADLGYYKEAAFNLSQASSIVSESSPSLAPLAGQLSNVGRAASTLGTGMQTYAARIAIAIPTQQVSQTLTQVAVLSWGMHPNDAQFLGMVGGAATNWTLNAATPNGQETLQGMYKGTCMENLAKNSPIAAGAITGLGLGSVQSAVNMKLYSELDHGDIKNTSARNQLASLGGSVLGSMAWSGIIGGIGGVEIPQQDDSSMLTAAKNVAVGFGAGIGQGIKDAAGKVDWKGVGRQTLNIGTTYAAERKMVNKNMSPEKAAENQAYAGIVGETAGMLLSHAPLWPEMAKPEEAKQAGREAQVIKDTVRGTDSYCNAYEHVPDPYGHYIDSGGTAPNGQAWGPVTPQEFNLRTAEMAAEGSIKAYTTGTGFSDYTSPSLTMLENNSKKLVALSQWNAKKENLLADVTALENKKNRLDGLHLGVALREPTVITNSRTADAFLEPVIYGLADLAVTNLRMDKQGTDQVMHDWTVMNVSQLAHSAAVALVNQKGWKEGAGEFGQIYQVKQSETYDDMFAFASLGKSAFGISNQRKDENQSSRGSMYGAALINDQLWNFTGVGRLDAQSAGVDKQLSGQDKDFRRMTLARSIPMSFFDAAGSAISSPTGGLAKYQTVRNMEAGAYTLLKTVDAWQPTVGRVNKELYTQLEKEKNWDVVSGLNRWIKESAYPAYFNPGEGGMRFSGFTVGIKDEKLGSATKSSDLKVENTVTGIQYPLNSETLRELDVNRPYDYKFPPFSRGNAAPEVAVVPAHSLPAPPKFNLPERKPSDPPSPMDQNVDRMIEQGLRDNIPAPEVKIEQRTEKNNTAKESFISLEGLSRTKSDSDTLLYMDPHQPVPRARNSEKQMIEGYEVVRPLGEGVYELKKDQKWQNDPHYIGVETDNGLKVQEIYNINETKQQGSRMDFQVGYVDGTTGKVSVDLNTKTFLESKNGGDALISAFKGLMR